MDKTGTQLTPEQIAEIREVFDYFDEDKDGLLSLKEFQDGCQGMGMVMDEETSEGHYGKLNGGKVRILPFFFFASFERQFCASSILSTNASMGLVGIVYSNTPGVSIPLDILPISKLSTS